MSASTVPGTYLAPEILGGFRRICPGFSLSLTIRDTVEVPTLAWLGVTTRGYQATLFVITVAANSTIQ